MRLTLSLSLGLMLLAAASLVVGASPIAPLTALRALVTGAPEDLGIILREIRLPRLLLGLMAGAALGLAGAALQGLLRNPLAEPGLIGVSPAAALGAVLALQTGLASGSSHALPLAALAGAGLAVAALALLSGRQGGTLSIILGGVAISAIAGALTSLVLNLSPNPFAASEIVFWMMGSLSDRSLMHVALAAPLMGFGVLILWGSGRGLDALTLGEETAASMGVHVTALRWRVVIGVAALVGAVTAVAGGIGFVGLVVPHLLRRHVGHLPSRLLPASALGGAVMVLGADLAARLIAPERDLKLGVITALIGAPFFLQMIWTLGRGRR